MTEQALAASSGSACEKPANAQEMHAREKEIAEFLAGLACSGRPSAEAFCTALALAERDWEQSAACSAACARCIMRFLLHKKCKNTMVETLRQNTALRTAIFGRLNTYQYSLIFLMKRLFRLNDLALTKEILELLAVNPYRDDSAKSYESRWSFAFLINEVLKAPPDYLRLEAATAALLEQARKGALTRAVPASMPAEPGFRCPSCGAPVLPDDRCCPLCGEKVGTDEL